MIYVRNFLLLLLLAALLAGAAYLYYTYGGQYLWNHDPGLEPAYRHGYPWPEP
jgi:hypothetical protein